MENLQAQTTRGRSIVGTMDGNMMNNNVGETACFAGRLPLDPFSPLYHIAVVLISSEECVCVCSIYDHVCTYERLFQVRWMRGEM